MGAGDSLGSGERISAVPLCGGGSALSEVPAFAGAGLRGVSGGFMTGALFARLDEDLALAEELLAMVPAGGDGWRPPYDGFSMGELVAHLVESAGGILACLAKLHPELALTPLKGESLVVFSTYRQQFLRASAQVSEADLVRVIPTYFVPIGEPFVAILLTNWKHLNHHVHQLFTYLKLLGVPVSTRHLYRFR